MFQNKMSFNCENEPKPSDVKLKMSRVWVKKIIVVFIKPSIISLAFNTKFIAVNLFSINDLSGALTVTKLHRVIIKKELGVQNWTRNL